MAPTDPTLVVPGGSLLGDAPQAGAMHAGPSTALDHDISLLVQMQRQLPGKANKRSRQKINDKISRLRKSRSSMLLQTGSQPGGADELGPDVLFAPASRADVAPVEPAYGSPRGPARTASMPSMVLLPSPRTTTTTTSTTPTRPVGASMARKVPSVLRRSSSAFEFGLSIDLTVLGL